MAKYRIVKESSPYYTEYVVQRRVFFFFWENVSGNYKGIYISGNRPSLEGAKELIKFLEDDSIPITKKEVVYTE